MFLDWPNGLAWRAAGGLLARLRRRKYDGFMDAVRPRPGETILDVGASGYPGMTNDFLEMWYPFRDRITACGMNPPKGYRAFRRTYAGINVVIGDGRRLPFRDNAFDVVFSNAVVEHVGDRARQAEFVRECIRVGGRGFMTTPNRGFPLESHTMLPFVHLLPEGVRRAVYRAAGKGFWADPDVLNLLAESDFLSLFPDGVRTEVRRQRILGMTSTIWIYFEKTFDPSPAGEEGRAGGAEPGGITGVEASPVEACDTVGAGR